MTKRYAPPVPHPSYHRTNDEPYFLELMRVAELSQTTTAEAFGVGPRTIRNRIKAGEGKAGWSYPEQFMLEVLADVKLRAQSSGVQDAALEYGDAPQPRTAWHRIADRRLTAVDVGKMVVGKDRFGSPVHGILSKDGLGLVIKSIEGLDVRNIPVEKVELYTLLDPPPG